MSAMLQPTGPSGVQPKNWLRSGVWMTAARMAADADADATVRLGVAEAEADLPVTVTGWGSRLLVRCHGGGSAMQPLPDDDFYAQHGDWPSGLGDRDGRLALAAVLDLTDDHRTRCEPIRVSAQNDVVILTGIVSSQESRAAAGAVARHTPGVRDLCNALRVAGNPDAFPEADRFDELTASVASPPRRRPAARPRSGQGRPRPAAVVLAAAAWCGLPLAVFAVHLPAMPVLLVTLALTIAAVSLQLLAERR